MQPVLEKYTRTHARTHTHSEGFPECVCVCALNSVRVCVFRAGRWVSPAKRGKPPPNPHFPPPPLSSVSYGYHLCSGASPIHQPIRLQQETSRGGGGGDARNDGDVCVCVCVSPGNVHGIREELQCFQCAHIVHAHTVHMYIGWIQLHDIDMER